MLKRVRHVACSLLAVVAAAFAYWSFVDGGPINGSTSSGDSRFAEEFKLVDHTGARRTAEDSRAFGTPAEVISPDLLRLMRS